MSISGSEVPLDFSTTVQSANTLDLLSSKLMHRNHLQTSSYPSGTLSRAGASGARLEYQTKCCSNCDRFGLELEAISPLFSQLFPDHCEVRLCFVSDGLEEFR